MSKCLKCGAALPPVGDCPACAAAVARPATPPAVPSLLNKDIRIDRRTPERTPAVSGVVVPSFGELARGPATPPGLTPVRPAPAPQAHAAPQPPPMPQARQAAVPPPPPRADPAYEAVPEADLAYEPAPRANLAHEAAPRVSPAHEAAPRVVDSVPAPVAAPAVPREEAPAVPASAPRPRPAAAPQSASGLNQVHEVHARPAALWRRLLSFAIDTSAIAGVATLYIFLASSITGVKAPAAQGLTPLDSLAAWMHSLKSVLVPGFFLLLVLATAYCAVAAFLWNGRTLGRLLLGLRLVDTHGLAPAPTRAILRALLSVLSFGLFLGGFWMALFDRRGQTLHDKLTSTFVIQPS